MPVFIEEHTRLTDVNLNVNIFHVPMVYQTLTLSLRYASMIALYLQSTLLSTLPVRIRVLTMFYIQGSILKLK